MSLSGKTDEEKFRQLSSQTYQNQAIWFLNAFWADFGQKEAETIWAFKHKCDALDLEKKTEGNALDEYNAHRFLEGFNQPMTVKEMRDTLRTSGVSDKFTNVPLVHFLITIYKGDWHYLVNAPQGDNKAEVEEAQRMLAAVESAFQESAAKAEAAAQALKEAEKQEADARNKEAEAKNREADAEQAKRELESALAELKAQEDAYKNKTEELRAKSETGGAVAQNKAKAELAQHLATPTLPLSKARITQEASVKKADKARQAASDARGAAEAATRRAVDARNASANAKDAAEQAVEDARKKVDEAEAFVEKVKAKPGAAQGAMWWIDRELKEKKAYLPQKKGGYIKDKK